MGLPQQARQQRSEPALDRLLRDAGARADEVPSPEAWQRMLAAVERELDEVKGRGEAELAAERARVVESYAVIRATLDAASEGILVVDSEGRVIAANARFGEMTSTPRELLGTRDYAKLVGYAGRSWQLSSRELARIEEMHRSSDTIDDELALPDGRELERYSTPIELVDGQRVGRVTFYRDVTEERAARRAIEAARVAAESASQAKSMFLANMSHELRTPLNAVIGLADLLLLEGGEPLSESQREYVEGIAQSGRHLLALVNDVLDLAKIEAGKQDLELEAVEVGEAVDEVVGALDVLAQHRHVVMQRVVDAAADREQVCADRVRLRQVLYNLLSNAVKFTGAGGRVTVRTRVEEAAEARVVVIEVADTGVGIADEDVVRLYRTFEQIELPSGDRPAGTGLGLALTKRLVEMHGGTIAVASRVGVGTTFSVRLPVA
ncbi:MAG TPA: PAS domain-containing sensor histidine kinase [Kofleriaceae bacterium]|nr:PAS domain-containing sensor histidine kinase [Kofleriaceae bacterium]